MISIEVEYITATCVIITFIQFAPDETERCRERKGRTMSASSKQKMLQSSHASFQSSVLLHTCNHPTPTPPGSRPTCLLKLAFHLVTGVPCVMHQHFSFFTTLNHLFLFGERSQRGSEEQSGSGCTPAHPSSSTLVSTKRAFSPLCGMQCTAARFACV